jgi:hypothetical protein
MPVHVPDGVLWALGGLQPLHRPDQRALVKATRWKEKTMKDLKSLLTSLTVAARTNCTLGSQ